jgi:tripartite-type tricarboxylate transporter receptor subunit TctC
MLGLIASLMLLCNPANAQTYPSRPVRIIVPAAAGGALDLVGRMLAQGLSQNLKQQTYVENKPGANMMIGTELVSKSAPDGYTLLYVSNSALTVTPYIFDKIQFDPLRELIPVAIVSLAPYILLANKSVPGGSLTGLVAYMREHPGKLNHASNSASTMLISELLKSVAQVDYVDVNFRGASNALVATQSGTTQFAFVDSGSGAMALQSNELRALGITTATRSKQNPDIPTFAEQGFPGLAVTSTTVLLVPKDTDRDIVETIKRAALSSLKSPDIETRFHAIGLDVGGQSGDEAYQTLTQVARGWEKLIKERNIRFGGER